MIVQVGCALSEQHVHAVRAVHERNQHRGLGDTPAFLEHDKVQVVRVRWRRRPREPGGNVFPCQRESASRRLCWLSESHAVFDNIL